VMRGALDPIAR